MGLATSRYLEWFLRQNEEDSGKAAPERDAGLTLRTYDPPRPPFLEGDAEQGDAEGGIPRESTTGTAPRRYGPPTAPYLPPTASYAGSAGAPPAVPVNAPPAPIVPLPQMQAVIGALRPGVLVPPIAAPDWHDLEALGAKAHAVIREAGNDSYRALGEAFDKAYASDGKSFQTYTKEAGELPLLYAGHTSGSLEAERNVRRRDAARYPGPEFGPAALDRSSTSYAAIRGREQDLVNYARWCGNSANRINPINPFNIFGPYYMAKAAEEFGGPVRPGEYPCPNPQGRQPR